MQVEKKRNFIIKFLYLLIIGLIVFFLAKEIRMNEKYMERCNIPLKARNKIVYAHANKDYDLVSIKVKTYKSTDSGVAFLVSFDDKKIYHAGDQNWWNQLPSLV